MHLRQVRVHKNTEINTVSIYPKKAFRNANNYMLLVLWYCLCDDVNWILSFAGENSSVCMHVLRLVSNCRAMERTGLLGLAV